MAITTSAGDGVRVTTAAKNGTLGSQAGLANDEIEFDTDISTNNGNIDSAVGFTGRLVKIRHESATDEIRYIIAACISACTTRCQVHEAWDTNPANGDAYHVSYVVEDTATVTGFSLISKRTRDYSIGREFTVGDLTGSAFAWYALLDGASLESDNTITPPEATFQVEASGLWNIGYVAASTPVPGGYLITTGQNDGDPSLDVHSGASAKLYSAFLTSVENNTLRFEDNSSIAADGFKVYKSLFNSLWETDELLKNVVVQGVTSGSDTLEIDAESNFDGITLINTDGFLPTGATAASILNYQSISNTQDIDMVTASQIITFVNPVWTGNFPTITWTTASGDVEERFGYDTVVSNTAGAGLASAVLYVFDQFDDTFQDVQTGLTDANGVFSSSLLTRIWSDQDSGSTVTACRGPWVERVARYGYNPLQSALTPTAAIDKVITLSVDVGITETASPPTLSPAPSMLKNPGGACAILMNYDGGATNASFVAGERIEGVSSNACATVVEIIGNASTGKLMMDTWNGTQFSDNEGLDGNISGSSEADVAGFYEKYTWMIDAQDYAMSSVYDWLAGEYTGSTPSACVLAMYEERVQLLQKSGTLYFTTACTHPSEGEHGVIVANRGTGDFSQGMVGDSGSGTVFVPPTQVVLSLQSVVASSQCYIRDTTSAGSPVLMNKTASDSNPTESYTHEGDINVLVRVRKSSGGVEYFPYEATGTVTTQGFELTVSQVQDTISS